MAVDPEASVSLKFLAHLFQVVPPRVIEVMQKDRPRVIMYSDASWEPTQQPRLGWVVIDLDRGMPTSGRTSLIRWDVIDQLIERDTQILACEALAVPQAIIRDCETFKGTDVICFIDNEAACSSMVRGGSSQDDVAYIAGMTHFVMLEYDVRVWFEWIDSDSNPSDGLSRLGLADPWTVKQGWQLEESRSLEWNELIGYLPVAP